LHTVNIPGGTAELLDLEDMTPRRTRAMDVIQFRYPALMAKLTRQEIEHQANVAAAQAAGQPVPDMPDPHLSEAEAEALALMENATIYAQLGSWTLDIPRPETVDAVQDMPLSVYNALKIAIMEARVTPDTDPASFEPNDVTVADDASPFPSSGSSGESSPAPARRRAPKTT